MGGRGGSSGGGGGGGSGGGTLEPGRVRGVEYLREPYERSPGFGRSHPIATPEGINAMQSAYSKANINLPISKATPEQKSGLLKQLNKMTPEARNNNLNSMAKRYLAETGKSTDEASIEKQLNKWKLSGISKSYSPKK